jgi:hypothetical protein
VRCGSVRGGVFWCGRGRGFYLSVMPAYRLCLLGLSNLVWPGLVWSGLVWSGLVQRLVSGLRGVIVTSGLPWGLPLGCVHYYVCTS